MSDLTTLLNQGREQVLNIRMVDPFDVKMGPIPEVVPVLREEGRTFADGRVILGERLKALLSQNPEQIIAWGNNCYDLADASFTFENLLKAQPDSPLLKGIRGVVETSDGLYVAVDAKAVFEATAGKMKYFPVRGLETVTYGVDKDKVSREAPDIVLLRYAKPAYIELSGDQFGSIDAGALNRSEFIHNRDMEKTEIVNDREIVHPVYKVLWSAKLVVPLVSETFKFNEKEYSYDNNMGVYLAGEPQSHAEMRAFCAYKLYDKSRLYGNYLIGCDNLRLVGVVGNGGRRHHKK